MLSAVWFLAVGLIFGAEIQGGLPGVLLILAVAPCAALAFGGVAAAIALYTGRASVVQSVFPLVFVILFMSSAFFPRDLLLEPASSIAAWNPLSLIAEGLREPIVSGATLAALGKGAGGVAIVAGIGIGLSAAGLRARLRAA